MPRIATAYTLQQLLDNQVGGPLDPEDQLALIIEMPLTANPNGWVTGSISMAYSDITFHETVEALVTTINELFNQSFSGSPNYDAVVDALVFGVDNEGYLTLEPRPNLGFMFRKYSSFGGPHADDVGIKDLSDVLGIAAQLNQYEATCPVPHNLPVRLYVDLQNGEWMSIYRATLSGDQLVSTVTMTGDGANIDRETFLAAVSSAFDSIGLATSTLVEAPQAGWAQLPAIDIQNLTGSCIIFKVMVHRNSDAETRFYVKIGDQLTTVDPYIVFPRAEQFNYLTFHLPTGEVPPEPVVPFVKFRNLSPNTDRRLEFIPINPKEEGTSIVVKSGEDFEMGGNEQDGYGICLSSDLCALTGTILNLTFNKDLSITPNSTIMLRDKRRGKTIGIITDLHLIEGRAAILNQIATLLRSSGLDVVLNIAELNWSLVIQNLTQKSITVELFLPLMGVSGDPSTVSVSGDVNTLQKSRDMGVYGANYSIAFCVAPKPTNLSCELVPSPWSNDITFDELNVPNQWGSISVSIADATFGGWNVGVNLTENNTIQKFIQNVISQSPPIDIEWRTSPNNPNAINIRYNGRYTGDLTDPSSPALQPVQVTFAKMVPGPVQDNRDQPWAQGTMAETRVCLANFFTVDPVVGNCYNTDTVEQS